MRKLKGKIYGTFKFIAVQSFQVFLSKAISFITNTKSERLELSTVNCVEFFLKTGNRSYHRYKYSRSFIETDKNSTTGYKL